MTGRGRPETLTLRGKKKSRFVTLTFDSSPRRRHPRADSATWWPPPRPARTWPPPAPAHAPAQHPPRRRARTRVGPAPLRSAPAPPHSRTYTYTARLELARQSAQQVVLRLSLLEVAGDRRGRGSGVKIGVQPVPGQGMPVPGWVVAVRGAAGRPVLRVAGRALSGTKRGLLLPPVSCGGLQL